MSRPDASGAKSLEEILASIRKSLSGDAGDAGGRRPASPDPGAAPPELDPLATDGALSQRLAGALGQTNGTGQDDDFTELLAPRETRPAPPPDTAPGAAGEGRDPLWFLKQPADPEGSNTSARAPAPPSPLPHDTPAPRPLSADEIKLSRPEVLRASLPPLFGGGEEQAPTSRAPDAAPAKPPADFTPAAPPRFAPFAPGETTKPAGAFLGDKVRPSEPRPGARSEEPASEASPPVVARADARAAPAEPVSPLPVSGQAPASAKVAPSPVPDRSPAKPEAAPPNARTLESAIGELLEPVIRQWLQANLPRLVEEMVRTEVARVLATDRGMAPKRETPTV
jgi:cell pole-organizing protein PopZ